MEEQNLYYPCNVTVPIDYYSITQLNKENSKITGSIEQSGLYNTTVLSCEYFHSGFSFELIYNNPDSCLGYNVQKILLVNPITALISITLFALWIINWLQNFTLTNIIHLILSLSFLFFVLQKLFYIFESIEKSRSNRPSYFQSYRKSFQRVSLTNILASFLTIENQYFLTSQKLKFFLVFLNLVVSLILGDSLLKIDYYNDDFDISLQSVLPIFLWESNLILSSFFSFGSNIGNLNIKFTVVVFIAAIGYVVFYTFYSIENTFLFDYYEVFCIDIINIVFMTVFGYYFRLKSDTLNNYLVLQYYDIDEESEL